MLLNYGSGGSGTHLVSSFWYFDSTSALKGNTGYATQLNFLSISQTLELYGRLHADLFNSKKKQVALIMLIIALQFDVSTSFNM